jgi:hypothetical protein
MYCRAEGMRCRAGSKSELDAAGLRMDKVQGRDRGKEKCKSIESRATAATGLSRMYGYR